MILSQIAMESSKTTLKHRLDVCREALCRQARFAEEATNDIFHQSWLSLHDLYTYGLGYYACAREAAVQTQLHEADTYDVGSQTEKVNWSMLKQSKTFKGNRHSEVLTKCGCNASFSFPRSMADIRMKISQKRLII